MRQRSSGQSVKAMSQIRNEFYDDALAPRLRLTKAVQGFAVAGADIKRNSGRTKKQKKRLIMMPGLLGMYFFYSNLFVFAFLLLSR